MALDFTGMTQQEIGAAKAQAIASALAPVLPFTYTDTLAVTISQAWVDGGNLWVRATATQDGSPVPTDDAYVFVNPPIQALALDGSVVEDPLTAGAAIVHDAVLRYARDHGAAV